MSVNGKMTAIADAIRAHNGGTEALTLDAMAAAIAGLETGSLMETGEIIGDGVIHNSTARAIQIPISFEPDLIFLCLTDTSTALDAAHMVSGILIRDTFRHSGWRQADSATLSNGGFGYNIDGLIGSTTNNATYADGVLSWVLYHTTNPLYNGASYTWIARKW